MDGTVAAVFHQCRATLGIERQGGGTEARNLGGEALGCIGRTDPNVPAAEQQVAETDHEADADDGSCEIDNERHANRTPSWR